MYISLSLSLSLRAYNTHVHAYLLASPGSRTRTLGLHIWMNISAFRPPLRQDRNETGGIQQSNVAREEQGDRKRDTGRDVPKPPRT